MPKRVYLHYCDVTDEFHLRVGNSNAENIFWFILCYYYHTTNRPEAMWYQNNDFQLFERAQLERLQVDPASL